ncbi:hypothetical protein Tcan_18432 [Toxocara canis]|uniref:Uncharacterized protein n=1 Tax=Toxocara canis TaxID=6265 RepID=A0A0B2VNZ2_TOXCA|nr:hypothetical protein Tcan_18432 [Toxocara canis]
MMLANGARTQPTTEATGLFDFNSHTSLFTPTTSCVKEAVAIKKKWPGDLGLGVSTSDA